MGPQFAAFFAAHKTAVLGGGAAAVAGLALLQRRKAAGGSVPAAAASVPATVIPAGSVAPAGASDAGFAAYDGLQQEIGQLAQNTEAIRQTVGPQAAAAPPPIASKLFAPNYTGSYVWEPNGTVAEIESDGSLFGLTHQQFWANPNAAAANASIVDLRKGAPLTDYTTASNVATANPAKVS